MAGLLAFVVLALTLCAIEAKWPAREQKRWRRGMWTDLAFWVATPVIARAIALLLFVVVVRGIRDTWFTHLPIPIQGVVVLVLGDAMGYWLHRFGHATRLWRFHKLHHSSEDLDWLSAVRVHPLDTLLSRALHVVPLVALGFDPRLLAAYVPLLQLHAILLHANVPWTFGPLRYVISSPAFHRWHHSAERRACNFAGFFPVWDLLFGTFYLPAEQPVQFGLGLPASPSNTSPQ